MHDSLAKRFDLLKPHITAYGPDDTQKRPAVLLFHACNGVRGHIHDYAQYIADNGSRAFVVDSFGARGWDHTFAVSFICTGIVMSGFERSGDVLAAIWGIGEGSDVDSDNIILAGWSHGGWAIMDLMTQGLDKKGDARLSDPSAHLLKGVKGTFLVYPYMNFPARSNYQNWVHKPRTKAVLARHDYLTPDHHGHGVMQGLKAQGVEIETLSLDATHCFDEEKINAFGLMAYDKKSHEATKLALSEFISDVF